MKFLSIFQCITPKKFHINPSVTLNYELIRNSLECENLKRVQILKNNIKNWFYKGIGALVP
jgi:hypothetical protein